jgi:hypothetical protein
MITTMPKKELIELGERYRAQYLVEQAGYTLGIAAAEGEVMSDLLPDNFLLEAAAARDSVNFALKDKTLMAEEAKDAKSSEVSAFTAGKVWRRRAVGRSKRAARLGKSIPDGLLKIGRTTNSASFVSRLKEMVELFEQNLTSMPGKDAPKLLSDGKELLLTLSAADTDKNVKRIKEMPTAVQDFYEQKGILYIALKIINDAGQELYADDANAAGLYNLQILHRRGSRRKTEPKATPTAE